MAGPGRVGPAYSRHYAYAFVNAEASRSLRTDKKLNRVDGAALTYVRRLVGDTVLRRSSLKSERFASDRLLLLPHAAHIERTDVVEPLRQCRYLSIVTRQLSSLFLCKPPYTITSTYPHVQAYVYEYAFNCDSAQFDITAPQSRVRRGD